MKQRKGWWVDVTDNDGSKRTIGPFTTYQEAFDWSKYSSGFTVDAIAYRVTYAKS